MVDKFRKTYPLKITFSLAEQPTNTKLSAISEQTRNGLALIESAIGDIWNQSGDSVLKSHPLQIPNLGRMLGANHYLNPAIYPISQAFYFSEEIGSKLRGKNYGYLRFKPKSGSTYTAVVDTGSVLTTKITAEASVDITGEWSCDESTGKIRTFKPFIGTERLEYEVDPAEVGAKWTAGQETLPGVIPDSRQTAFTSCKITLTGGVYTLHLPPRLPLTFTDDERERPNSYPTAAEALLVANGAVALPAGENYKYWQNPNTALADAHYRYALPKELQDAGLTPGVNLPAGFLYLYDEGTDTIIEDITFTCPTGGWTGYTLEVSSDTYSFTSKATALADQSASTYNSTSLVLITSGSPLTHSVWSLLSMFLRHEHKKIGAQEPALSHGDLEDPDPPSSAYTGMTPTNKGHNTVYPTYLPSWVSSRWAHDRHTSLLSRVGSQGTAAARRRDLYDNAMLGHLVLANADTGSPWNFLDAATPDNSFKLCFGATNGPSIYADSNSFVRISHKLYVNITGGGAILGGSDTGVGVEGGSTSSYGVKGESTNHCGVYGKSTGTSSYAGVDGSGADNAVGVRGASTNAYGVYGVSTSGAGVKGESSSSFGIYGTSDDTYGVWGASTSGIGVYGLGGADYGVKGESNSSAGVYGFSTNNIGIYGQTTGTGALDAGVYGIGTNCKGVYGASINKTGVYGQTASTDATEAGVYGSAVSTYGIIAEGNATRAPFRIIPQANEPTGPNLVGDLYVKTGDQKLYLCTVAGTPGTWAAVGP